MKTLPDAMMIAFVTASALAVQIPWLRLSNAGRIGDVDGPTSLTDITDMALSSSGDLHVLSGRDAAIKVFASNGALKRTLGRRGQGPGELMGATRIGFIGGKLWVNDPPLSRTTFFEESTGELGATLRMPSSQTPDSADFGWWEWSRIRRLSGLSI